MPRRSCGILLQSAPLRLVPSPSPQDVIYHLKAQGNASYYNQSFSKKNCCSGILTCDVFPRQHGHQINWLVLIFSVVGGRVLRQLRKSLANMSKINLETDGSLEVCCNETTYSSNSSKVWAERCVIYLW